MPAIKSPNPRNYAIPRGFMIFTPDGGVATHLGNLKDCVYTPEVNILPHMSTMAGTKVQDFSVILQSGGKLAAGLEEQTAFNLGLFFNANVDASDPDNVKVGIFDQLEQIVGAVTVYATNNVGPRWNFNLTRVLINPTGNFEMIGDTYKTLPINMTHVIDDEGLFGNLSLQADIRTISPQNVLLPFIDGPLKLGDDPAFAKVGEIMTANVGQWIAAQGFTYQWKKGGVNIGGATSKTYTPVIGDVGAVLAVAITATNLNGSTSATSGNTLAVHA